MSTDWDEIKRLAADFQKVQLSSTLQRLSERNCVEIVTLLIEKGYLDVIFTTDGKEYITPDHLEKEILDELFVHGGRVNLVELSKILNVDFSQITLIAEKVAKQNDHIYFMLGQLIDEDYIIRIATEINEKLQQSGEISISDLTIQFDLPSEFLQHYVVEKHLGKIIRGRQDPNNPRAFFTQSYILRCKAKIRGALTALTKPTSVASILQQIHVHEKIFHTLLEEINPPGNITSKLSNAQYIPYAYARMQTDWLQSFYKQNGYLEYDSVAKLGISDPKQFIKKQFPNEEITFLKRYAVGSKILDITLDVALNECITNKSYVDLSTILPSSMSDDDIKEHFTYVQTTRKLANIMYLDKVVFSNQYLEECVKPCYDIANNNAKIAVRNGSYQQYLAEKHIASSKATDQDFDALDTKTEKREERKKKAALGKGGGGTQGRETKTRSTKKHLRGVDKDVKGDDNEDESRTSTRPNKTLELITIKEIKAVIFPKLEEEGLEHLCNQIAQLYHQQLNQFALGTAQTLYELTPQGNRRQAHSNTQEILNNLLVDVRLYEKGLKLFPTDVQNNLIKYLLKTIGNDICNEIALYMASECNLNIKNTSLNYDQRMKIAQECEAEYKIPLMELNKSLTKASLEEFVAASEQALKSCSMILKKIDKKKDRSLILQHKEKLCQQLKESEDPALILHLAVLIIFTGATNCILHASGRFVLQIIQFLLPHLSTEQNAVIQQFHDLVLKFLNVGEESEEGRSFLEQLKTLQEGIIDLALSYDKPGVVKAE